MENNTKIIRSAPDMKDRMCRYISLTKENEAEMSQKLSEDNKNNYEGIRAFAKIIASQWFRQSFCKEGFCAENQIEKVQDEFEVFKFFDFEYEKYGAALLYAYWLFFSGMALVYAEETINFSKRIKEKFSGEEKTSTSFIFFKFLIFYAQAKDYSKHDKSSKKEKYDETIKELNNCINESKENTPTVDLENTQNIILAAVRDKRDMIENCINKHLTKPRMNKIISQIFPELENSDVDSQKKALLSLLRAGVAKIYFNQGTEKICNDELDLAIDLYRKNTLAMIQRAQLPLAMNRNFGEREKYAEACNTFKKIIKLIDTEKQFTELPLIQLRIKFDAHMELAHLYSKIGDYENANECYMRLKDEICNKKEFLTDKVYSQFYSILLINWGRNYLNSKDYNSAIKFFEEVLEKGDILGSSSEIRSIAHMNLGLAYYDFEDNFEKAKSELIQAIKIDPTNAHSYYNLGVLYYVEKRSIEKAKKFINKSLYTDIENIDSFENNKNYEKFKESLDRLNEGKNANLRNSWWQWWFGSAKERHKKNENRNILVNFFSKYGRKIIGTILLIISSLLVIKLNYDLYLHDYLNLMYNSIYTIHSHTLSNTDFILLGINIAILLLPVISRLKIADVEIEIPVESKGNQFYQLMPYSNSIMRPDDNMTLNFGLFIIDLWY